MTINNKNKKVERLIFLTATGLVLGLSGQVPGVLVSATTTGDSAITERNMHSNYVSALNPLGDESTHFKFSAEDVDEASSTASKHVLKMPTDMPEELIGAWTTYAKQLASADAAKTGRQQEIVQVAATDTTETIQIGNPLYPRMDVVDVASYQSWMTQADFNQLKAAGIKAVIVKLTEGSSYVNPYATQQITYALNAGLRVSVYHYARFASVSVARAEAQAFANAIKARGLDQGITVVADLEDNDIAGDVGANLQAFWATLSSNGFKNQVLYTGRYFSWSSAAIATVGVSRTWIAQYPYTPRATNLWNTEYGAWQFSSTARLTGSTQNLDVSIDYNGLFTDPIYDNMTSYSVNYTGTIVQVGRKDGLFINGPYYTSANTVSNDGFATAFDGQRVSIDKVAKTVQATWVRVTLPNGQRYWMDKRGVALDYDPILSTKTVNYWGVINAATRSDGLYSTGPYFTSALTEDSDATSTSKNGAVVSVLAEAVTKKATWLQVRFSDGQTFWIDKAGVNTSTYDPISDQVETNQVAQITNPSVVDGLFTGGPYRTSAATLNSTGAARTLAQQYVSVIGKAKTVLATWAHIQLANGTDYWIDNRLLSYVSLDVLVDRQTVNQNAVIANASAIDGLFVGGPYNTSLTTLKNSGFARAFLGQQVTVLETGKTNSVTWAHIKMGNGTEYWIDNKVLKYDGFDTITDRKTVNSVAAITNATAIDGLFVGGPYNTSQSTQQNSGFAKSFAGQEVLVLETAKTAAAVWAHVRMSNGSEYWVDNKVLGKLSPLDVVTQRTTVNQTAVVASATPIDGLFIGGPYNTSLATRSNAGFVKGYVGQNVTLLETAKTAAATWAHIRLTSGAEYWVDNKVLKLIAFDTVTDRKAVNLTASIAHASAIDGLFVGGPYNTSIATQSNSGFAKAYAGQVVTVTEQARTSSAMWAHIRLASGADFWLDNKVLSYLQFDTISDRVATNYSAVIAKATAVDGLFAGGPYNTSLATMNNVGFAKSYVGQTVTVIETAKTSAAAWAHVRLPNGTEFWLDIKVLNSLG